MGNDTGAGTAGLPCELLTSAEHEAADRAGLLYTFIATEIVGDGPTREDDLRELATAVHAIQHMIMAQAVSRAYPGKYRALGYTVETSGGPGAGEAGADRDAAEDEQD